MVSCKHCHTPNTLDSTFCKRCGAEIPEDTLNEAKSKLEKLIEEGNALFNQARVDEALAIADAAVEANPSSTIALSLKTLCHERRGEIAEALDAADKIVDLNPGSDFDRIRRSTLRQKLQTEFQLSDVPDRRFAVIGGVAACVLVVCLGVIAARWQSPSRTVSPNLVATNQNPTTGQVAQPTGAGGTDSNPAPSKPQGSPANPGPGNGTGGETGGNEQPGDNRDVNTEPPIRSIPRENGPSTSTTGGLPLVGPGTGVELGPGTPIGPLVPDGPQLPKPQNPKADPDDPNVGEPNKPPTRTPTPASTNQNDDPGKIEIKLHSGSVRPAAGVPTGSQSISGNGLQSLVRVGSSQFELGNYEAAAKAYEQAIQSGGDAIILNRRLGLAYQRLGRSSDAADAYKKCISAVDAALSAGRGNRDVLMSTRDLCQQELKGLGG